MSGPRKEGQPTHFEIPLSPPEILEVYDFPFLENLIRKVKLFDNSIKGLHPYLSSEITLEEVSIDTIYPCALYVLNQNLEIQRALRKSLLPIGIDTFNLKLDRGLVTYSWGGQEYTLTPQIIEVSEDDGFLRIITDGLHRITAAKEVGRKTFNAVVIKNTAVPLSPLPVEWKEVRKLDKVPPTREKRRLRFESATDVFRWFGLNNRNLERVVGGLMEPADFGYKTFFRDLDFGGMLKRREKLIKTREECLKEYRSAGVLITTLDTRKVLLGNYQEAPELWGNFAGRRTLGEKDPRLTAARELKEEVGIEVDPYNTFGKPLIINNTKRPGAPKIGVVYLLPIDRSTTVKILDESEIKSVSWFTQDDVAELMDWSPPDLRLWGGIYTRKVLYKWLTRNRGTNEVFSGIVQIDGREPGPTSYEELKKGNRLIMFHEEPLGRG